MLPPALVGCTSANPKAALDDVNKMVAMRTGQQMRGMSDGVLNALLQTNLTAQSAVTIAPVNNRSLQAEFEEIGISLAVTLAALLELRSPFLNYEKRSDLRHDG